MTGKNKPFFWSPRGLQWLSYFWSLALIYPWYFPRILTCSINVLAMPMIAIIINIIFEIPTMCQFPYQVANMHDNTFYQSLPQSQPMTLFTNMSPRTSPRPHRELTEVRFTLRAVNSKDSLMHVHEVIMKIYCQHPTGFFFNLKNLNQNNASLGFSSYYYWKKTAFQIPLPSHLAVLSGICSLISFLKCTHYAISWFNNIFKNYLLTSYYRRWRVSLLTTNLYTSPLSINPI